MVTGWDGTLLLDNAKMKRKLNFILIACRNSVVHDLFLFSMAIRRELGEKARFDVPGHNPHGLGRDGKRGRSFVVEGWCLVGKEEQETENGFWTRKWVWRVGLPLC